MKAVLRFFILNMLLLATQSYNINFTLDVPDEDKRSQACFRFVQPILQLPPLGQFTTGAAVGYASSQLIVSAAVGIVKIVGTAYVISEVLHQSGYLDQKYLDQFEQDDSLKKMRYNSKRAVNRFRIGTERQLRRVQTDVRRFFSSDFQGHDVNNLGSGFAAGAVAGFLF